MIRRPLLIAVLAGALYAAILVGTSSAQLPAPTVPAPTYLIPTPTPIPTQLPKLPIPTPTVPSVGVSPPPALERARVARAHAQRRQRPDDRGHHARREAGSARAGHPQEARPELAVAV